MTDVAAPASPRDLDHRIALASLPWSLVLTVVVSSGSSISSRRRRSGSGSGSSLERGVLSLVMSSTPCPGDPGGHKGTPAEIK